MVVVCQNEHFSHVLDRLRVATKPQKKTGIWSLTAYYKKVVRKKESRKL